VGTPSSPPSATRRPRAGARAPRSPPTPHPARSPAPREEPERIAKPPDHPPGGGIHPQQDAATGQSARGRTGHPDGASGRGEPERTPEHAKLQLAQRRDRGDLTAVVVQAPQPDPPVAPAIGIAAPRQHPHPAGVGRQPIQEATHPEYAGAGPPQWHPPQPLVPERHAPHRLGADGKPPDRLPPARGVGDHQRPVGTQRAGIDAAEPHDLVSPPAAVRPHPPRGPPPPGGHPPGQSPAAVPDRLGRSPWPHACPPRPPPRPRPADPPASRRPRLQLRGAGHPVAAGVDPQQAALRQQHPDGILTGRGRRAGQRHPSATASPEATGVASVLTVLLVGWDTPASPSGRLPACRRPTATRATSITTTPAATSHPSRLAAFTPTPGHRLRPFRQIVHLAHPSRPAHPVLAGVAWWKGGPSPSAAQDLAVLTGIRHLPDLRLAQLQPLSSTTWSTGRKPAR
jgi:hypothetical protein